MPGRNWNYHKDYAEKPLSDAGENYGKKQKYKLTGSSVKKHGGIVRVTTENPDSQNQNIDSDLCPDLNSDRIAFCRVIIF